MSRYSPREVYIKFQPVPKEGEGEEEAENETNLNAFCGDFDLTDYLNAWESLPPLKPLQDIGPEPAQV